MLTLNDGRSELYQWDTGRKLSIAVDCTQVHYSNKVFGRSIDVDVVDGIAIIPDILLQTDKELTAWAFVGTPENGYTKISKTFKVNRRNKPADYVFTPPEQTTLDELVERLQKIEEAQDPDAIKNAVEDYLEENPVGAPVQSVNEKTGKVQLTAKDVGAISQEDLQNSTNKALEQAKESGEFDGKDGTSVTVSSVSESTASGGTNVVTFSDGKKVNIKNGTDGTDGKTPVKGVDYFTEDEVEEIAETAAGMVPSGGGDTAWKLVDTVITDVEINYAAIRIPDGATETMVLMDVPAADESRTLTICAWVPESRALSGYAAPEFIVGDKARKIVFRHSRIADVVHCLYGSSGVYIKTADPIVGNYVLNVSGDYLSIGGVYTATMIPVGSTITMYAR